MYSFKSNRGNGATIFTSNLESITDASYAIHKAYCTSLGVDHTTVPYYPNTMIRAGVYSENLESIIPLEQLKECTIVCVD